MPGWRRLPTPPRNPWGGYQLGKNGSQLPLYERISSVPEPYIAPSAVDTWVASHRPSQPEHELPNLSTLSVPSLEYLLNYDTVQVHLQAVKTLGAIEGPFQDPALHTLHLTLHLHPSTGFLVYFNKSPTVILDQYKELSGDRKPDWITLREPLVFRQPRAQMIEILAFLAQDDCNKDVSEDVVDWCHSITLSNPQTSISIASRAPASPPKKTVPFNIRPHKNRSARPQLPSTDLNALRRSWTKKKAAAVV